MRKLGEARFSVQHPRRVVAQPPLQLQTIRDGALSELEHVSTLIANLSPRECVRPSAVDGWTIGEVAAHLDLFLGLYSRFLSTILAGGGSGGVAKAIGLVTGSVMPRATPIFDGINGFIPKPMARMVSSSGIKRQFVAGARATRHHLLRIGPDDYGRPVHFEGGPYPLWFYLGIIVNELAIHGWDIESRTQQDVQLSDAARGILPWFYWSGTPLMLRPPKDTTGTVQIFLTEPVAAMWCSMFRGSAAVGTGVVSRAQTEIRGASGPYLLTLAGRAKAADMLQSSLAVDGDYSLAESFLNSWHLI